MPLLEGTDGVNKMSKSLGNYIAINDNPRDMFGKIMSISDELMLKYYTLLTDEDIAAVRAMHPKEAKANLAKYIVSQYYSNSIADEAADEFSRVFTEKEIPQDIPEFKLSGPMLIVDAVVASGQLKSKNEARRLIQQGGLELDGVRIGDVNAKLTAPGILKIGSRRFLRITV